MIDDTIQTIMEKLDAIEALTKLAVCSNCAHYESDDCWFCYNGNKFVRRN